MLEHVRHVCWQVTHLGYHSSEEEAARVYDRIAFAIQGDNGVVNFPEEKEKRREEVGGQLGPTSSRKEVQKFLGVKTMDKSSRWLFLPPLKGPVAYSC
jgi:hypothetical protein